MTRPTLDGVERYKAAIRVTRWICFGGAIVLAGWASYFTLDLVLGGGWTRVTLFLWVFSSFMAVVFLVGGAWKWAPGATNVSVDERGIMFTYPGGRVRQVLWTSPGLPLTIYHTDGVDDEISRGQPVQAVAGRLWLQDFLTDDTYRVLLDRAKALGLSVSERPGLRPGWTRLTLATRPTGMNQPKS